MLVKNVFRRIKNTMFARDIIDVLQIFINRLTAYVCTIYLHEYKFSITNTYIKFNYLTESEVTSKLIYISDIYAKNLIFMTYT